MNNFESKEIGKSYGMNGGHDMVGLTPIKNIEMCLSVCMFAREENKKCNNFLGKLGAWNLFLYFIRFIFHHAVQMSSWPCGWTFLMSSHIGLMLFCTHVFRTKPSPPSLSELPGRFGMSAMRGCSTPPHTDACPPCHRHQGEQNFG